MNRDANPRSGGGRGWVSTTSRYGYAESFAEAEEVAARIGYPLVMKPVMSSSGKGQSKVDGPEGRWKPHGNTPSPICAATGRG